MEERYYDLIFIARPATPEEEIKKILGVVEHTCAEKGGKVEIAQEAGLHRLGFFLEVIRPFCFTRSGVTIPH